MSTALRVAQKYSFATTEPELLNSPWWIGHIPFAFQMVKALEPAVIVELGVYSGSSFFAFCQAAKRLSLPTTCYGIDEWVGDIHMGRFEENVYEEVCRYRDARYPQKVVLIRKKFDDAVHSFKDKSIDLLHIDGTHTYASIRNDFSRWLPKISERGVVLLHDTNITRENFGERAKDYGTRDFFQGIKDRYPHIEFKHCYGLGVLIIGEHPPPAIREILEDAKNPRCIAFFARCGKRVSRTFERQELARRISNKVRGLCSLSGKARYLARNVIRNPFFRPYRLRVPATYGKNRPRVLHFIGNFHTGGSPRLVVDLVERLGDRYESEIITRRLPELPHYRGVNIRQYKETEADKIRAYLQAFRPDFLHVHYWGTIDYQWYKIIFKIAEELRLPVIENVNIPIAPYLSKAVFTYVYVSSVARERYSEGTGRDTVIYPGTDYNFFERRNPNEPSAPCIGMVYRLEKDKLNENAIDVFIKTARRNAQVKCLIIGNGYYYDIYKKRVRAEGMGGRFRFTGYVGYDTLPRFYEKMTVFVAPVHTESFGHVVPIAMGMGIPVAGYNVGALSEILADTSLLAPPGDSDALSKIVIGLLNNRALRMKISHFNRQRAAALFSIQTTVKRYDELYGECLTRGRASVLSSLTICIASLFGLKRGYGGIPTHSRWLMKYFKENSFSCIHVSPYDYHNCIVYPVFAVRYLLKRYFKTASLIWFRQWHCFFLKKALAKTLACRPIEVINAQEPLSALAALQLRTKQKHHYQVVLTVHMNASEADEEVLQKHIKKEGWYYRRIKRMEQFVLRSVDKIIFVSEYARQAALREHPELAGKPNAVIQNGAGEISCDNESVIAASAPQARIRLINMGSLNEIKNQEFLVHVVERLVREFPDIELCIIGSGGNRAELEKEISSKKLGSHIRLKRCISDAQRFAFLKTSFLYVHSSLVETSSYAIIEAMSFGVPAVSLATGGVKELIRHGDNGFLVEDGSVDAFAGYVRDLIRDRGAYEAMRAHCREAFAKRFDYRLMGEQYVAFYTRSGS